MTDKPHATSTPHELAAPSVRQLIDVLRALPPDATVRVGLAADDMEPDDAHYSSMLVRLQGNTILLLGFFR